MIYDILYRDGANYKKWFRAEIADMIVEELRDNYADGEWELDMTLSGLSVPEFFKFMDWSYDPDIDHSTLTVTGLSDDQETPADITFSGERQIEMVTKEETIWVCADCGSREVQTAMWVDMNTDEIDGNYGSHEDIETNWCKKCQEHVQVTIKTTIE